jgi:hypothetical protein
MSPSPSSTPAPVTTGDASKPTGPIDCAAALRALAGGHLDDFHGLARGCGRADAERAFGSSGPGPDDGGMLGGSPTLLRRHPSSPVAPYGLTVYYVGDRIVLVEILEPRLPRPPGEALGAPEASLPSLVRGCSQSVYAGRGLAAHVKDGSGEVRRLYAFEPMSVDAFRASYLSGLGETRRWRTR